MLAVEPSHRENFFDQPYARDSIHPADMEFIAPPQFQHEWYSTAEQVDMKPQMTRTTSANSVYQHEFAPGLSHSNGSIRSGSSSTVGSPYSGPGLNYPHDDAYLYNSLAEHGVMEMMPAIVAQEAYSINEFSSEVPMQFEKMGGHFVDPSLIGSYPEPQMFPNPGFNHMSPMASPAPSPHFYNAQFAQPMTHESYMQQPYNHMMRQPSHGSHYSPAMTHASPASEFEDGENRRCPYADCGKLFKDLKAHILTHQAERPEKCPITTCEYHRKGFSRKYDKNRHTLTHYKGTMVCGFCPGSGTPSEKSFNRADVFKRHLTSVHGVEQTPPNSRKRSPTGSTKKLSSYCADATGKCSTCNATFNNAQDFYEHLDECVMRVVQQEEPTEAINEQHLSSITNDEEVQETFDRHMIKTEEESIDLELDEDDEEDEDEDEDASYGSRTGKKSKPAVLHGGIRKKGVTWSQGGVKLAGKGRKNRKNYPPSWGMSPDRVTMKKRVLVCYDGQRRLVKDDMMLSRDFEVRMALPDGESYVTDLDVETMNRAEGFHGATEEERGPWLLDEASQDVDLGELMS